MGLAIAKLLASVLGIIKALMLPLAVLYGKYLGRKEAKIAQDEVNARAQAEYTKIAIEDRSDEDVDSRLDGGTF